MVIGALPPIFTVKGIDKLHDLDVVVLNEMSSKAKSFPAEAVLVSKILIIAIVAPPEFHVPLISVHPALPPLVAEIGKIVIGVPFIKT